MTVKEQILALFKSYNELTVKEICDKLQVSKQMVHIVMKAMLNDNVVEKLGRVPKTVYRFIGREGDKKSSDLFLSESDETFLKKSFCIVTESGSLLEGKPAFDYWCRQRKLPVEKTFHEFVLTKKKYAAYYDKYGNINGIDKLKNTRGYETIWLDKLFYLDFYAIERFGKTFLGTLLHYAKQGQNKYLMGIMMDDIQKRIEQFVELQKADAIGFVPPTIRREVQLMKFMQSRLHISLPLIEIKKVSGIIPVPQKSLSKLEERIRNAENTFMITEQRPFNHIVLIDDAVGSGSTLNQIAGKIKRKNIAKKITGLSIVGSFKGFDVISSV